MAATFAEVLSAAREERGWSQQDLADHLGVSQPTVVRWSTGYTTPSDKQVPALARFLKLPARDVRALVDSARSAAALRVASNQRAAKQTTELPNLIREVLANQATILERLDAIEARLKQR